MKLILLLILLVPAYCLAQRQVREALVPDWVHKDVKGIKFVMGLAPIEKRGIGDVEKQFEDFEFKHAAWSDKSSLGFGAERIKLNMGLGYTTVYIDYLVFKGQIVHYTIGARVSSKNWPHHGETVMNAWKEAGGPAFNVVNAELTSGQDFPTAWREYYEEIGTKLGPLKTIEVPLSLADKYKLLTDPFENSRISFVACDDGKPAIDALEDAKRVDLIENVLRGYNPGGRIYATISLLRLQQKGRKLSPDTQRAIEEIINSDASVSTCLGHTGVTGLTARDVVPEYVKSKDWHLLRK
jgi:hypothetical protein